MSATPLRLGGLKWSSDISGLAAVGVIATLGLLLIAGALLQWHLIQLHAARSALGRTFEALQSTIVVQQDVIDAETGQRGYLLTGEARYLAPYREATRRIWRDFARAEDLATDEQFAAALARVSPVIEQKLAELAETVSVRAHSFDDAVAIVRTDAGQQSMEQIREALGSLRAAEARQLEELVVRQNARARTATYFAIACGALALASAWLGALGIVRRRDSRILLEQNARLEQLVAARTAELESANAALDSFASTVAHELRAPVRATAGYALAVQEDMGAQLAAEQKRYLERISQMAERMDDLIDDVLSFSRVAYATPRQAFVSLDQVVERAVDLHRSDMLAAGADVEIRRPLPAVSSDAAALREVLSNLIGNGLKFMVPGRKPVVRIWAEQREEGMIRVWVADNGIGISPSHQERIFQPFERLHGREAYPGSGIGLAIVQRVMDRLGGACGVVSAPDQGSRFWIDVPGWHDEGEKAA